MSKLLQLIISLKDEASANLDKIQASLGGLGTFALGGLVAVTAAVGALGASSLSVAADFESASATFKSVAGGSLQAAGFSLEDVKNKALEMGAVTQFSAAQAQEAMINLAKGGVPVADIMGQATQATLDLAAAGEVELATAADIVSKQLGVWGDTGVQAAQVSNLLAQAANASTVDVEELALGLANVGGVAKVSGVRFQDMTQTMALLAPGFSSASDAGTSFKTFLLSLSPTAKPAQDAMRQLGLITADGANAFYNADGSMRSMGEVAQILQGALAGLSEQQQATYLKTIFGTDAFRAAAMIAQAGSAGFDAMGQSMAAAGTAADQAAIRNATFKFAWDSLLGTLETIQIVIGSALLPVLTALVNTAIIPAANQLLLLFQATQGSEQAFAQLSPTLQTIALTFNQLQGYAAALAPYVETIFALLTGGETSISNLAGLMQTLATTFGLTAEQSAGLISAMQQIGSVVQPVVDMLGGSLTPILVGLAAVFGGALLAAIGGLIASFAALIAPIAAAVAIAAALYAAWSSNFLGIQGIVSSVLSAVIGLVQAWGGQIMAFWSANGAQIMSTVQSVLSAVIGLVQAWGGQIMAFWSANGAQIMSTVQSVWSQLSSIVGTALQLVAAIVTTVLGGVAAFIQQNGADIQAFFSAAWGVLSGIVSAALSLIEGIIKAALALWQGDFNGAWEAIKQGAAGFVSGIITALQGMISGFLSVGKLAVEALQQGWKSYAGWNGLGGGVIDGIISGITGGLGKLLGKVREIANSALTAAKNALGIHSPSTVFAKLVGIPIIDGMVEGIQQASPKAVTAILDVASKLIDVVGKGVDAFGKLRNLGEIPTSAISQFSASINLALRQFADMAAGWDKAAVSWASQFTAKAVQVVDLLTKGVDFLAKVAELGPVAPDAISRFASLLQLALDQIVRIAQTQTLSALASAQGFAKAAGDILGVIKTGVDALTALQNLTDPPAGSIARFAQLASWVVLRFAQIAGSFTGPALGSASSFAEGAGKVLGIIKTGVDALTALQSLPEPVQGSFQAFAQQIGWLVLRFAQVAGTLEAGGATAAAKFAESAGKILSIIKSGVEGLTLLSSFAAPAWGSIATFRNSLMQWVGAMVQLAGWFAGVSLDAAVAFAQSSTKILSVIKGGVEGLSALSTFVSPAWDSMASFRNSLMQWVGAMVQLAGWFEGVSLDAAVAFAESAGKVLGILKSGVEGLTALRDIGAISEPAIDAFAAATRQAVAALAAAAATMSVDAAAAAGKFSEGAGKVLALLKNGVEGLLIVDTFTSVSPEAIARFGEGVRLAVAKMAELATLFGTEATESARLFAVAAGESTDFLKKGVDGFAKLADLKDVPEQQLALFADSVIALVKTIIQLSSVLSNETLLQANTFANAVDMVIKVVLSGLKALGDLGDGASNLKAFTAQLVAAVQQIAAAVAQQAKPASENIGINIALGVAQGITIGTPAIQNAVFAAVNAAIAAARQALGIASPSKVFDTIGQFAGAGLAQGLDTSQATVAAAASSLADTAPVAYSASPSSPSVAPRGGAGVTSSSSTSLTIEKGAITIVQSPGENSDAVAQKVLAALERKYKLRLA